MINLYLTNGYRPWTMIIECQWYISLISCDEVSNIWHTSRCVGNGYLNTFTDLLTSFWIIYNSYYDTHYFCFPNLIKTIFYSFFVQNEHQNTIPTVLLCDYDTHKPIFYNLFFTHLIKIMFYSFPEQKNTIVALRLCNNDNINPIFLFYKFDKDYFFYSFTIKEHKNDVAMVWL